MLISALLVLTMNIMPASNFRQWGLDSLKLIQRDLLLSDGALYAEEARPGEKPTHVAFNWGVGVMIQALNSAAKQDPEYRLTLACFIEATRSYWNTRGPVPGYDVLPNPGGIDRYYDDNEWMVLALVEASSILKSKSVLLMAKDTFRYVMSGMDTKLGGGIYWRESDRASKNTCANGPAAAAALALYEVTHETHYLQTAKELYAWTKSHLRDPSDGLYWDNIQLSGAIEKSKWSYNTGLMLRSASELYRFTKDGTYADDAREMQLSSLKQWVAPDGSLRDDGKFVHLLAENWLRAYRLVPGVTDPHQAVILGLTRLHDLSLDSLGHYGNRWDETPSKGPYSPFKLIDQASAVRMFLEASSER